MIRVEIKCPAMAGTMESSDVQIYVRPIEGTDNKLSINSPVKVQFGHIIEQVVRKTLKDLNVQGVEVNVNDRGALDATITARLQTALFRATDENQVDWEVAGSWNV